MRVNVNWIRVFYVMFVLAFAVEQASGYVISASYKYVFMAIICMISIFLLRYTPGEKKIVWDVLVYMGACTVIFTLVSLVAMFFNGFRIYPDLSRDLFRILGPAGLAFLIYNTDRSSGVERDNAIDFYFTVFFIIELSQYLLTTVLPNLSIESIMSISLIDSYSPFETTQASRFTVFLVYYIMRKKPLMSTLAFLANLLTFKRFNMLFAVFFFLFGWIPGKIKKDVPNWLINLTAFFFCLAPVLLMFFVSDLFVGWFETTFDRDFNQFTMGRLEQVQYIFNYNGSLLGLGSTKFVLAERLARYGGIGYATELHSDLQRFYVETSILGLVAYVVGMFNLVKIRRSYSTFILMVFILTLMMITPQFGDFPPYFLLFLICQIDFDSIGRYP